MGAPDDLHRLVVNLVENALVHTAGRNERAVTVRRPADDQVTSRSPTTGPASRLTCASASSTASRAAPVTRQTTAAAA